MIYLDNAATTLQKPSAVRESMCAAMAHMSTPGRGGHKAAMRAANLIFACRREAADLFGVQDPERVVFTMNATHALNIAIKTLVRPGGRVLISGYEHNAVLRPLSALRAEIRRASSCPFEPSYLLHRMEEGMRDPLDAVICTHVSNVFGYILPVREIADLCAERGIPLIVDASQSAGILPVDAVGWKAAFVCMPGHKGLYGPQGTGLLLCTGDVLPEPLLEGGTGSMSAREEMPDFLPDRLEAGTQNTAGIAGLLEGIRFVRKKGERILSHERELLRLVVRELSGLPYVRLYTAEQFFCQTGVVSFRMEGMDCEQVGETLAQKGIATRAGLHCAPDAHRSAGTFETGTVRASFSVFNTEREIRLFSRAVREIAEKTL